VVVEKWRRVGGLDDRRRIELLGLDHPDGQTHDPDTQLAGCATSVHVPPTVQ